MGRKKWEYCSVAVEYGASPGSPPVTSVSENLKRTVSVLVRDPLDQWADYLDGQGWALIGKLSHDNQGHLVFRRPQ